MVMWSVVDSGWPVSGVTGRSLDEWTWQEQVNMVKWTKVSLTRLGRMSSLFLKSILIKVQFQI